MGTLKLLTEAASAPGLRDSQSQEACVRELKCAPHSQAAIEEWKGRPCCQRHERVMEDRAMLKKQPWNVASSLD